MQMKGRGALAQAVCYLQRLRQSKESSQRALSTIPCRTMTPWILRVQGWFRQLVLSVKFMHENGYCHRDLSLENCMFLDAKCKIIKLIDFGTTLKATSERDYFCQGFIGKLGYAAPEVCSGWLYDARKADVWSLGIMLFIMLIGTQLFTVKSPAQIYPDGRYRSQYLQFLVNGQLRLLLVRLNRIGMVTDEILGMRCIGTCILCVYIILHVF